ncbi:unnamed protein product, partial [Nippostrongylus brasiliensis]|uniref:Kelch domain-containing protein 10 n=1 Tax=Nippostrongylus brasiliensis TaxID=27835 RepID=A0A0N4XL99_NIPBR
PAPRSGHRIFVDDEFLYVVGGKIYTEVRVWRYNLLTQEWTEMSLRGNFPTALASFSCECNSYFLHFIYLNDPVILSIPVVQSYPYSNQVVLFGGTAVPFGASTSSSVHLLYVDNSTNSVVSTEVPVEGEKMATYGHVS